MIRIRPIFTRSEHFRPDSDSVVRAYRNFPNIPERCEVVTLLSMPQVSRTAEMLKDIPAILLVYKGGRT
jgi:hypothetical protein